MSKLTKEQKLDKREEKKRLNEKFSNLLKTSDINMTEKTKYRIEDCGSFLEFISDKDLENYRLSNANFCNNRFCPHCSFNASRKNALKFEILLKYIKEKYNYSFLFLTLTSPNVKAEDLKSELDSYYKAFNSLVKRNRFKNISKGFIRKFEITYNKDRDDYHPHYHIIISVNSSYFNESSCYISHSEWLQMWRECKKDLSITQVDIRRLNDNNLLNSVFEMSKYLSKDSDYLYNREVFENFYRNLKGRRYLGFSGVFSEANKLYKLGKLDYLKEVDTVEYIYKVFYIWKNSKYNLNNVLALSEEEKNKFNFDFKNEVEDLDLKF